MGKEENGATPRYSHWNIEQGKTKKEDWIS
jgi:hypothetical protein